METVNNKKQNSLFFVLTSIKALLSIAIGLAFLINPMGMVTTFSYLLGIALLIFGATSIYNGIKLKPEASFWALLIEDGILQLIVGIILLAWPGLTPNLIMIILGIWIIFGGIIQMIIANKYKDGTSHRNFRGILTIILGGILIFNPDKGVRLFSMIFGTMSLLYGIYMIYLLLNFGKTK
jgi:uncharacterized membrane protein HdeD (DUF308 family)